MTTQFKCTILGLLASSLISSHSFSQQQEVNSFQPVLSNSTYLKVYENVLTEFHKLFEKAENVRWSSLNKHYLAKFSQGDLEQRALLDNKGNLIYKISYGKEKHLPADIRKLAKRNYVEFVITAGVLVEEAGRNIWIINLEDETHYAIVRVENSELEELRKYRKMDNRPKK